MCEPLHTLNNTYHSVLNAFVKPSAVDKSLNQNPDPDLEFQVNPDPGFW